MPLGDANHECHDEVSLAACDQKYYVQQPRKENDHVVVGDALPLENDGLVVIGAEWNF